MIRVAVEIRQHTVVRRVRVTAESIERAMELCDGNARVIIPIAPSFGAKDVKEPVEEQTAGASERRTRLAA